MFGIVPVDCHDLFTQNTLSKTPKMCGFVSLFETTEQIEVMKLEGYSGAI